jgi:hypothetical protein
MSWGNGGNVMADVIVVLVKHIGDATTRQSIYEDLIRVFESHDCDNLEDECCEMDPPFDAAIQVIKDERAN